MSTMHVPKLVCLLIVLSPLADSRAMDPRLDTLEDSDMMGPGLDTLGAIAESSCNKKCSPRTKELMKMSNQCRLRSMRTNSPRMQAMPADEFVAMVDNASDLCIIGDICYTEKDAMAIYRIACEGEPGRQKREVDVNVHLRGDQYAWPTDTPILYNLNEYNGTEEALIEEVIQYYRDNTCLTFMRTDADSFDGLQFTLIEPICASYIGRVTSIFSPQPIFLGLPCVVFGIVAHEIGHALGLLHEHTRSDRDEFVEIFEDNIRDNAAINFFKRSDTLNNGPYDYGSVMHYRTDTFANGMGDTLGPKDPAYLNALGQLVEVTFNDLLAINRIYCRNTCNHAHQLVCQNSGYQDPVDCSRCRCPRPYSGTLCDNINTFNAGYLHCGQTLRALSASGPTSTTIYRYGSGTEPDCKWQITGVAGYSMVVYTNAFGLTSSSSTEGLCINTWLEVYDGNKPSTIVPRYCGGTGPDVTMDTTSIIMALTSYFNSTFFFSITVTLEQNDCTTTFCSIFEDCVDTTDGPTCVCKTGFSGSPCSDIDECSGDNPCESGETCTNTPPGSYTCTCNMCIVDGSCVACGFAEDMLRVHNEYRRRIKAEDMIELEYDAAAQAEMETIDQCDGNVKRTGKEGYMWHIVTYSASANPVLSSLDFTEYISDSFYSSDYNPANGSCTTESCQVYRGAFYKHHIRVACAQFVCSSTSATFTDYGPNPGDQSAIVIVCSYFPLFYTPVPQYLYTLGTACANCPLYRPNCRNKLCSRDAQVTTTSTPVLFTPVQAQQSYTTAIWVGVAGGGILVIVAVVLLICCRNAGLLRQTKKSPVIYNSDQLTVMPPSKSPMILRTNGVSSFSLGGVENNSFTGVNTSRIEKW